MNTIRQCILVLGAVLIFLCPAVRSEQSQKSSRVTQEERIKKLEERADAAEKTASSAAMEKDYIARAQKLYESYYQRVLNTQLWTLGITGLILTAVFGLVVRFSLNMFDKRTKAATDEATAQMRNEYARTLAKEVQKLWDSNAADIKKMKEGLAARISELEQNVKDMSDFQIQFVQGLAGGPAERHAHSHVSFRNALRSYKAGKPRNLIETKVGATAVQYIFDALRKSQGENFVEKAREELAEPLYNDLEEELALAALQSPWLTPLINERSPAPPEPSAPDLAVEPRSAAPIPEVLPEEPDVPVDEESSCRLING